MSKFIKNVNFYISQRKIRKSYISMKAGIEASKLSKLLNGWQEATDIDLKKIASALGKDVEFFLGDTPKVPPISSFDTEEPLRMEWNVYCENVNAKMIVIYNIFDFEWFDKAVKNHLCCCKTKEEFGKNLESSLNQYFGGKAEWEIVIGPFMGDFEKEAVKIDIYDQVKLNWNVFLEYVWSFRKEIFLDL